MSDPLLAKAHLLVQQQNYKEADRILAELLQQDPTSIEVLALMCEVRIQQNSLVEARSLINSAIGLQPEAGVLHYIKAKVELSDEQYDAAEGCLNAAIQLDPLDGDYYALRAHIRLNRKKYKEALEWANKALELDSENILALNVRSKAQLNLNDKQGAFDTIEGALNQDPNNPFTHANYGWTLLEKGEHKKALKHFSEALRLDPNLEMAQAGMAEALKARYMMYRWFLKYSFWIGKLTEKYQWGVIIGFYLGVKGLNLLASSFEALQPFLIPLIILLTIIAFSTWVIHPISNLFLRLNKFGKHLLTKKEIMSSNFVGLATLTFLIGTLLFLSLWEDRWLTIAVFGFTMMIPCSVMFTKTRIKHVLLIATGFLAVLGALAIYLTFTTGNLENGATIAYLLCIFGFQWGANFLMIREDNK